MAKEMDIVRALLRFDLSDPVQARCANLLWNLPRGVGPVFIKALVMKAMPQSDDELDLMVAKILRQGVSAQSRKASAHKKDAVAVDAVPARQEQTKKGVVAQEQTPPPPELGQPSADASKAGPRSAMKSGASLLAGGPSW